MKVLGCREILPTTHLERDAESSLGILENMCFQVESEAAVIAPSGTHTALVLNLVTLVWESKCNLLNVDPVPQRDLLAWLVRLAVKSLIREVSPT